MRHGNTDILINHTGYDVTDHFRMAVIEVQKTVENVALDGFRWNLSITFYERIAKFHTVIGDKRPHKTAGYDVASCFRSAEKCN